MNIILTLLIVLASGISPMQDKINSEVTFCNFDLPRNIKVANATFDIVYSFEVDEEGRPVRITKVNDKYVGEGTVASCMESWRFHGIKNGTRMVALFQWRHGEGWTNINISGPDFSQKIKVGGERCPYLRMQLEEPIKSSQKKGRASRQ